MKKKQNLNIPGNEFQVMPPPAKLFTEDEVVVNNNQETISDSVKKPLIENREDISEVFMDVLNDVCNRSSLVVKCEYCGRTYFGGDGDFEEDEFEELRELAKQNPEMYIECEDYTRVVYVNGKEYVLDCPCMVPKPVEKFLWSHRDIALKFIAVMLKEKIDEVEYEKSKFREAVKGLGL